MSKKPGPEIQKFIDSAEFGLWGVVAKALNHDGAVAPMDAFIEGRAIVQIDVLFSTKGMTAEAYYICDGSRVGLFNIRDNIPPVANDSPTPLRLVHCRNVEE